MSNFLTRLTKSEQARLLEKLNYQNLEEIRGFCSERGTRTRSWPRWLRRIEAIYKVA